MEGEQFREGLSRFIMETMASRLPYIVSRIRRNVNKKMAKEEGDIVTADDVSSFIEKIDELTRNEDLRTRIVEKNLDLSLIHI